MLLRKRSTKPVVAVSLSVSQPRASASSSKALSRTVFPMPRGPIMREILSWAPGPSSSAKPKSSMASLRPTSNGGVAPSVAVKGLVCFGFMLSL